MRKVISISRLYIKAGGNCQSDSFQSKKNVAAIYTLKHLHYVSSLYNFYCNRNVKTLRCVCWGYYVLELFLDEKDYPSAQNFCAVSLTIAWVARYGQ